MAERSASSTFEYRSSSPVIFELETSLSSSTAPLAIVAGSSFTVRTTLCSFSVSASSWSAIGPMPSVVLLTQSACSILWKPHHSAAGTSPSRASMFGSRSPKDSATGSIRS